MKITPEQLRKIEEAARRKELIDAGVRPVPRNQVHKKKTDWRRKPKHPETHED